jgi:hypothetical protein
LIVVEALHAEAAADVQAALDLLAEYLSPRAVKPARLTQSAPLYPF